MNLVYKFDFVDRYRWSKDQILAEALVAANRRGELIGFYADSVEILDSTSTKDGEIYSILVFGKYTNEYLA